MLGKKVGMATLPVRNLEAARTFYETTLGLTPVGDGDPSVISYKTDGSGILVYESQYAGTNQATAITWNVGDDLDSEVRSLKSRGVTFEHYDMPETTLEGDVHVMGEMRVAWFKDPDGNIHSLANG